MQKNNLKYISFFLCIFALILTKIIWEKKSKFGDIKNEEKNDLNDNDGENQNYGTIDKLCSDLFDEFLHTFCSLPFIIFIMKTEDKKSNIIPVESEVKDEFNKMKTVKINAILVRIENNSTGKMKNKNENEIRKNCSEHYKDKGLLTKSQFYCFTFVLFYVSRICLILYWNLDKNSQITEVMKWHLILPNIILSNCFLTLLIIKIMYLNQNFTNYYNKKVENNETEKTVNVNVKIVNNYFINYLLQERFNLFLLFILFRHFSNFYTLSLGSRSAPILSISLLIFMSIATPLVSVYLRYDDNNSDNNDENDDIKNNTNMKNNIQGTEVINNNNKNNTKNNYTNHSITSTIKNKNKLEKSLLLAAFVLHIGMFSRMFFFISGHNFDFGSLQVRNFYFIILFYFIFLCC